MSKDAGVRSVEELHTFGVKLKMLGSRTQEIFHDAQANMNQVSEGWDDAQQAQFAQEFSEFVKQIDAIATRMMEHSEYIQRQCQRLEAYLNGR